MPHLLTAEQAVEETSLWLEKAVIGLNLCPFAKSVYLRNQVRFFVSNAQSAEDLLPDLAAELTLLKEADPDEIDTTLLIHPWALQDFLDFNDFLEVVDALVAELGMEGDIQVASFHPHYRFAGSEPDDMGDYTNRSPHPTLHLLREASIERAVSAIPDARDIFEKNIETMRRLGKLGWQQLGLDSKKFNKK